jgi:hypothetical protein
MKWQTYEIASLQNSNLVKWQVGQMASWSNGKVGEISWHLFNAPAAKFIEEIKFDFEIKFLIFKKKKKFSSKISQSLHKI